MKSLIWKEFHENLKWTVLVLLLVGGLMKLSLKSTDLESVMNPKFLTITSLVGAAFAAILGFLQFCFEAHGDRRAFLLHRPISATRIFLGKALTGLGLYAVALGVPFLCAAVWAATPGKIAAPFRWPMVLPGFADIMTGTAYYFAGALAAGRDARWYGSRGLGLVAAIFCSTCVWLLPEFIHAVAAIVIVTGLLGVAAWGSFIGGGEYGAMPRSSKLAMAATFLTALLFVGLSVPAFVEAWMEPSERTWQILTRQGQIWNVHNQGGEFSVTDLAGQTPPELNGQPVDGHLVRRFQTTMASLRGGPNVHWYRFPDRMFLPLPKEGSPGERWFYVVDQARLLGYDLNSRCFIGSIGPDGFVAPTQRATSRFEGELRYFGGYFIAGIHSPDFLPFSDRAYIVDYGARSVKAVYVPDAGQTILAAEARDDRARKFLAFMLTEEGICAAEENGTRVFSAPLVFSRKQYRIEAAQLGDAQRFAVWYYPDKLGTAPIGLGKLATLFLKEVLFKHVPLIGKTNDAEPAPSYLVEFDAKGNELDRLAVPSLPVATRRPARAFYGLGTPLAGYLLYSVADRICFAPGNGASNKGSNLLLPFTLLMLLSAAASAFVCYLLARHYAFSRARRIAWFLCGLSMGLYGILLMLSLQEWPAKLRCNGCSNSRVVTRNACEHCGAAQRSPMPDGTEIFGRPEVAARSAAVWAT